MGGDGVTKYCSWLTGRMIRRNMTMFVENPPSNREGEHQYENDEKEDDSAKGRREDVQLCL